MCVVANPKITGGPVGGDNYRFDVTYTAKFDPAEINGTFTEFIRLRESDSGAPFGGGDDNLTAPNPVTFVATASTVGRHFGIILPTDVADTEIGHEEVYAEIWLRSSGNLDESVGPDCKAATASGDFNP
ncbi:hypothetical protein [Streptomyces huiliensis]|uniref:hypothetical protein n=1 Tax=Streptomyces huiliensis TaxID=2876027 RepID=UPI001CBD8701|nr:hypothetical protein [Streptomyces huiliensis]MBZ4322418.1 hypothetical protein [Streptomyces huiliensis]